MFTKKCIFCQKENPVYVSVCRNCGFPLDVKNKELSERIQIYRRAAEQGYSIGQSYMGDYYRTGQGLPLDYGQAAYWYRKAADQGDYSAQNNLGAFYENGQGVSKDLTEAVRWYQKSADQGYKIAQYNLGRLYKNGKGVTKDYAEAARWFRKAADQGDPDSQYYLGVFYDKGQGVPEDDEEAVRWYRKAAEQGITAAQNDLGACYHIGEGVRQDYAEALKWYRKASAKGNAEAQYNMGLLYKNGNGVPKDLTEAVKWFRKAAEQGHEKANAALASLKDQFSDIQGQEIKNTDSADDGAGTNTINAERNPDKNVDASGTDDETVESLLEELNALIGLKNVKKEVQNRINRIRISQHAKQLGSKRVFSFSTPHMVFTGNPGTGKTTVARLLGKIYGKLGVLKKPEVFVECGRDDLVAEYIGQTAVKVKEKFEEARGGILFIDEAYSLYKKDDPKDFGHEAISTIVQYMEDMRDDTMVIVAGYREEMEAFIRDANPGLASRFRIVIHFEDYTPSELMEILESMIRKDGMILDRQAREPLKKVIRHQYRKMNFGNARGVRNMFEELKEIHDARLADMISQGITLNAETIDSITAEDAENLPGASHAETLDVARLLSELDSMVGLRSVKKQLRQQIAIVQTQLNAEKAGVTSLKGVGPQHMIFAGNPGTGKTTVARLVGKIYEALGLIADSSIFVECDRSDLVGQWSSHTASNVDAKIREAQGGILFIDEAYSLYRDGNDRDFGREAINELVNEMENHRDNLIIIMAGYSQSMRDMVENANPGLKSRFPIWLEFEDFTVPEMSLIFIGMIREKGYRFDGDIQLLQKLIEEKSKEPGFGNARGVRNLADKTIAAQSMRLSSIGFGNINNPETYSKIEEVDLLEVMKQESAFEKKDSKKIGF